MLPTFLGIGAPKAGTTWLAHRLADHPQVCFCKVKEPDYFSYGHADRSLAWYRSLFVPDHRTVAAGEFSTNYLACPGTPLRLREALPEARLLVCLRNPVDQVYSHYWHLQRQNFHGDDRRAAALSFEDALDRFPQRLIQTALYANHLRRWLRYFEADRFLFLLHEEMLGNPCTVLQRTFEFIGVDGSAFPPAGCRDAKGRKGSAPRNVLAARAGATTYAWLNQAVYRPLKKTIGPERAEWLKERTGARTLLEWTFRRRGYPKMRAETRARLARFFRDSTMELGAMIGRDLGHWAEAGTPVGKSPHHA